MKSNLHITSNGVFSTMGCKQGIYRQIFTSNGLGFSSLHPDVYVHRELLLSHAMKLCHVCEIYLSVWALSVAMFAWRTIRPFQQQLIVQTFAANVAISDCMVISPKPELQSLSSLTLRRFRFTLAGMSESSLIFYVHCHCWLCFNAEATIFQRFYSLWSSVHFYTGEKVLSLTRFMKCWLPAIKYVSAHCCWKGLLCGLTPQVIIEGKVGR